MPMVIEEGSKPNGKTKPKGQENHETKDREFMNGGRVALLFSWHSRDSPIYSE